MRSPPFFLFAALFAPSLSSCEQPAAGPRPTMDTSVLEDDDGITSPLVCPGSIGCSTARGQFRAGGAARAITPTIGAETVWLAGFGHNRPATGVHDDQWVRALVVEQGDTSFGLVVVDTVGLFHDELQRIRELAQQRGVEIDQIWMVSTHSHAAKDTMGLWGESSERTGLDQAFQDFLVSESVEALRTAQQGLTDVSMRVGEADATGFVNDTRLPYLIDPTVRTLDFVRDDGSSVVTLVAWGNHPESISDENRLLSSDYPHFLRETVEERLPGTVAIFAPGLLGGLASPFGASICPDENGVETCPAGTWERTEKIGVEVGTLAAESVVDAPLQDPSLGFRRYGFLLVPEEPLLFLAFSLGVIKRGLWDTESGERVPEENIPFIRLEDAIAGYYAIGTEVGSVSLGTVEMTSVPGELYSELWLAREDGTSRVEEPEGRDFADATPEPAYSLIGRQAPVQIVLNQANDALGYIVPVTQWDVDAPYAYDQTEPQYGERNSLGAGTAKRIADALTELAALKP